MPDEKSPNAKTPETSLEYIPEYQWDAKLGTITDHHGEYVGIFAKEFKPTEEQGELLADAPELLRGLFFARNVIREGKFSAVALEYMVDRLLNKHLHFTKKPE